MRNLTIMDILDLLRSRRSIRKFKSDPVPDELIQLLLEAGQCAPSRSNSQPWKFIVITDRCVHRQLYDAVYRQALMMSAPLLIAVLGIVDVRRWYPQRTAELVASGSVAAEAKDFADHILDDWNYAELRTDAALNSGIAATQIMLAAHSLGLGCCWVKLCDDDRVLQVLGVPAEGYYNAGLLAIGYPNECPKPRSRLKLDELVSYNHF